MSVVPSSHSDHNSQTHPVPFIDLVGQYNLMASEIMDAVQEVFAGQKFVLGDEVEALEREVAGYCNSREAVGCGSGTDALTLSMMALDIGPGDEVITTPFSFFASVSTIYRLGAKPVFVDIDPVSFNIDASAVEKAITEKTKAIMPVHLFGQCAEMESLWRLAVRDRLSIIEDACQAIGAEYRGRRAGVLGTLGCFSFYPTKNLSGAGDGGLITTDDPDLANRLRRLRVHGDSGGYDHIEVGICSRLDALQAAVLRVKLKYLEDWTSARQKNAKRYAELFRNYGLLDAVEQPNVLPERRHVYNQYCVRIKGSSRDVVLQSLRNQQIGAAIYYPVPLHLQKCFEHLGYAQGDFPHAEAAAGEVLALPIFPELTGDQQETVVRGIAVAMDRLPSDGSSSTLRPQFLDHSAKRAA